MSIYTFVLCAKLLPAYLLRDGSVTVLFQPVQLISLPQQRVEGLGCTVDRGGVRGHREGRHQAHLLQGGAAASGAVQQLAVFQVLGQALQHGQRLVEVYLPAGKENVSVLHRNYYHPELKPFSFTGIGILERSLPMQFFMMLHRLRE